MCVMDIHTCAQFLMVLGTMGSMFMCVRIVVMFASVNAEGVTVVYGTRGSDCVTLILPLLFQSGLAAIMSVVHASFSNLCPGSYSSHVILLHTQSKQYKFLSDPEECVCVRI